MRVLLKLLTFFSCLVPIGITLGNTVGCGVTNNVITIYGLGKISGSDEWVPIEVEREFMIELDKTQVQKYTLQQSIMIEGTRIVFYFKDGTVNDTNKRYWSGTEEAYTKYLTDLLGIEPEIVSNSYY